MRLLLTLVYSLILTISCFAQVNTGVLNHFKEISNSIELPEVLEEISGLAVHKDGRIFCNQDEDGTIYWFDLDAALIMKDFHIGAYALERDFEGIAIANTTFYLISSSGVLFEFEEGEDKFDVEYNSYDLDFGKRIDVEGLAFDEKTNSLLIACKDYPGRGYKGNRAFYSFNLTSKTLNEKPRFLIDLDVLEDDYEVEDFYPSAVEFCPFNESIFILSSKGESVIVEISYDGAILNTMKLNNEHHIQPEGISFLQDKSMIISDEADGGTAKITIYKYGE